MKNNDPLSPSPNSPTLPGHDEMMEEMDEHVRDAAEKAAKVKLASYIVGVLSGAVGIVLVWTYLFPALSFLSPLVQWAGFLLSAGVTAWVTFGLAYTVTFLLAGWMVIRQ